MPGTRNANEHKMKWIFSLTKNKKIERFLFTYSLQPIMPLVYVITGASRGIGLELVRQIAEKGNIVFACARNPEASKDLQKIVDNKRVFSIKLDTLNKDSITVSQMAKVISCVLNDA